MTLFVKYYYILKFLLKILYECDKMEKTPILIIEALLLFLKAIAKEVKINYNFSNDYLFTKPIIMGY